MPIAYVGSITFLRNGKRERLTLTKAPTFAAVQALAQALYPYTTGGIPEISFTQLTDPELPEKSGDVADAAFALRVKLRWQNPPANTPRDVFLFDIPAPAMTNFDHIQERGYRLKTAAGETIAAAYSTFTGQTWAFEEGWLCGG